MIERLRASALLRRAGIILVALGVAAAGFVIGARVAPDTEVSTSIGRVSFSISPSSGGDATALIPVADYGFRANAFDAPFDLEAELRSLERSALQRAADGDLPTLESTEDDLEAGVRSVVITTFGWGTAGALIALVLATLIWRTVRPRWILLVIGGGAAILVSAVSLTAARTSFDSDAFQRPTYFANGDELARVLEIAENERVSSPYGSEFASILRGVTTVLVGGPIPEGPSRDIYLGSDFHANALVVGPLADVIADDPLILAGDFGQRGGLAEAQALAPRVAALGSRVIATSGNHDSTSLMSALEREGVTVLGDGETGEPEVGEVDGLRIAGFPDPLEYTGAGDPETRPITFGDIDDPDAFDDAADRITTGLAALDPAPDVVVIHQAGIARAVAERLLEEDPDAALTILNGHDHDQRVSRFGDVIVVDGGTVGAGGLFGAGRAAIGFAELHFETASPRLRSVDLISIEPFSGQAQATRVVINSLCPDEERCDYEPPRTEGSILGAPPDDVPGDETSG